MTAVKNDDTAFVQADDPFEVFADWFEDAKQHEPNDPNAMALATVDVDGMPNVRMVLLKGLDATNEARRGFVFYTNLNSVKGAELLASQNAALLFHWKSLGRQVRLRGNVSQVSGAEADAYFQSRSRGSRIGAWASMQSQPLQSRALLEERVADYTKKFAEGDVPRPENWSGFRLVPTYFELWQNGEYRLHDRVVFQRPNADTEWARERLYP